MSILVLADDYVMLTAFRVRIGGSPVEVLTEASR